MGLALVLKKILQNILFLFFLGEYSLFMNKF